MPYEVEYPYGPGLDDKTGRLITETLPSDGNMAWSVSVEPTVEPVTVAELKTFSRIGYSHEDTLLEGFITATRRAAEQYTGKAFLQQTITVKMDYWPGTKITLPVSPLISIEKVATLDEDDTETTYAATNYYSIKQGADAVLVIRQSVTAPVNTSRDYGGYLIRYKAGFGTTADNVPQLIRESVKLWAASFQSTRQFDPKNPPPEAKGLLDFYRSTRMIIR